MPLKDSREVQHIVDELNDDRKDVGRSSPIVCPLVRYDAATSYQIGPPRLRLPRQIATAKWRHDAGSRVPALRTVGSLGPPPLLVLMQSTLVREYSVRWQFRPRSLRDASPGSESSPPGRLRSVRHCTGQVAREEVSGPAQLAVPTPRHLGILEQWR